MIPEHIRPPLPPVIDLLMDRRSSASTSSQRIDAHFSFFFVRSFCLAWATTENMSASYEVRVLLILSWVELSSVSWPENFAAKKINEIANFHLKLAKNFLLFLI